MKKNIVITAQHEETGRMWTGNREDIPARYFEVRDNSGMYAYTIWGNHQVWYVNQLLGDGHPKKNKCDWGYGSGCHAIKLSPYWQKRFKSDTEKCGRQAFFCHFRPETTIS